MSVNVLPNTLTDIINKVRRITGRPSPSQLSNNDIISYINTFYIYDMPEHLRLESLRSTWQFTTSANLDVYDFPTNLYLTTAAPIYIAGYQSYMTQSRENFYRLYPNLDFLQQLTTGNGGTGPYTGQCSQTPIIRGFQGNPPGAYSATVISSVPHANSQVQFTTYNVIVSGQDSLGVTHTLVDDGLGNLVDVKDPANPMANPPTYAVIRGNINYVTGVVSINSTGFTGAIATGNPINIQYTPYVASRPQAAVFYQDQIILRPIPDQAYIVSIEAYEYPSSFLSNNNSATPQLNEWWQLLAYGAADKIFADNGDFENLQKFRPLMEEQMNLVQRRTIVQQTSERTSTIYTEQTQFPQYPFGNLFSGF